MCNVGKVVTATLSESLKGAETTNAQGHSLAFAPSVRIHPPLRPLEGCCFHTGLMMFAGKNERKEDHYETLVDAVFVVVVNLCCVCSTSPPLLTHTLMGINKHSGKQLHHF